MIYALIGSTSLFFLLGGGAVFLFAWAPSRNFMSKCSLEICRERIRTPPSPISRYLTCCASVSLISSLFQFLVNLLGWGLGLGITICIKMIITICLRKNYQKALYRKKPRTANITGLCLMCWNIALGAGVMLGRLTQFLLAAAFWIGRTDAQFLDEDGRLHFSCSLGIFFCSLGIQASKCCL